MRSIRAAEDGNTKCSTPGEVRFGPDGAVLGGESGSRFLEWMRLKDTLTQPAKKRITLFLDADVLAFFKDQGPRYQRVINDSLRESMDEQKRKH